MENRRCIKLVVTAVHLKSDITGKVKRSDIIGYRLVDIENKQFKDVKAEQVDRLALKSFNPQVSILVDISRYTRFYGGRLKGREKLVIVEHGDEYIAITADGECSSYSAKQLLEFINSTKSVIANAKVTDCCGKASVELFNCVKKGTELVSKADITEARRRMFDKRYCPIEITVSSSKAYQTGNIYKMINGMFYDTYTGKAVTWGKILKTERGIMIPEKPEINKDELKIREIESISYAIYPKFICWRGFWAEWTSQFDNSLYVIHENKWQYGTEFTVYVPDIAMNKIQTRTLEELARAVKYESGDNVECAEIEGSTLKIRMLTGYGEYDLSGIDLSRSSIVERSERALKKGKLMGMSSNIKVDASGNIYEIHCPVGETVTIPEDAESIEANSLISEGGSRHGTLKIKGNTKIKGSLFSYGEMEGIWLNNRQQYRDIVKTLRTGIINELHVNPDISGKEIAQYIYANNFTKGRWLRVNGGLTDKAVEEAYDIVFNREMKHVQNLSSCRINTEQIKNIGNIHELKILYRINNASITYGMHIPIEEDAESRGCQAFAVNMSAAYLNIGEISKRLAIVKSMTATDIDYESYIQGAHEDLKKEIMRCNDIIIKPVKKVGTVVCPRNTGNRITDVYSSTHDGLYILYDTGKVADREDSRYEKFVIGSKLEKTKVFVDASERLKKLI